MKRGSVGWLVIALGLAGCPTQESVRVAVLPYEGQTIGVTVPGGAGLEDVWEQPLIDWSAETGAKAQLAVEGNPLSNCGPPGDERPEGLLVAPLSSVSRLRWWRMAGVPASLQGEQGLDWLDLFQGLREVVGQEQGEPWFVPLSAPVLVMYYRADLLAAAERKVPETWDEYHQLAVELERWAPGLKVVEPWGPEWRATTFLSRAAAGARHPAFFSMFLDIETGEPRIANGGFVRALEQCARIREFMPDDVLTYSVADCRRELLEGRAALGLCLETGPDSMPLVFGPVASTRALTTRVKITRADGIVLGFTRLPGVRQVFHPERNAWEPAPDGEVWRIPLTGFSGAVAAVSRGSGGAETGTQTEAAWNAFVKLTQGEGAVPLPASVRGPTRESDFNRPTEFVGREFRENEAAQYLNAVASSLRDRRLVCELPWVCSERYRSALAEELEPALKGVATAEESLGRVAERWRSLQGERSHNVRDSYRRSLGLGAKGEND